MRHHPEQYRLWNSQARHKFVCAGRGSGKTELGKRYLVRALPVPIANCLKPKYFASAPTYAQVEKVWWEDLKALVPAEWLSDKPDETHLIIKTRFGSSIELLGLDKPMRAEGSQYCGGIIDERSDTKPSAWSLSIRPTLSTYSAWTWQIGVPKRTGIGAPQFRQKFEYARDHPSLARDAFWWRSSDILPASEITDLQEDLSMADYLEQGDAQWLDSGGILFSGFSPEESVRPCKYNQGSKIYVGCDFNVHAMSWCLGHWDGSNLYMFDELRMGSADRFTNTQAALDALYTRYPGHTGGWYFAGDASSRANKTSANRSDYVAIEEHPGFIKSGRIVNFPRSNPPIVDKAANTNRMLCNAAGQRRVFIDPSCTHLLDDMKLQAELKPISGSPLGHMSDALGYLLWKIAPLGARTKGISRVIINPGNSWVDTRK